MIVHIPVLKKEVLEVLDPSQNENFIDATIGWAGHTRFILDKIKPEGKVLGIERDSEICESLKKENIKRLVLINDSYDNLKEIIRDNNFEPVAGILFDLGMSSWHLEKSGRGFSFLKDEPLDMRYNTKFSIFNFQFSNLTAERIVNEYPQEGIERILRDYGEERYAGRLARKIVEVRKAKPIKTTFQLVEIIKKAGPRKTRIHPATRTFQALRIAVNNELNVLNKGLSQIINILEKGGRVAVISFHSLEDRIVKNFFKENKNKGLLRILTKKPIMAQKEEIKNNPRCRSARLRAAIKL
ncbi:MAG: 16S rRNA (cytosine(1402)-N(4))-methyltransferase RsmH [Candidatus Nealsonbacteria bacterium]|nr:16S rRNA (cytosine(1402)-N(4))-methyltransferase RsmH [Candidatus Nealsonbacteria bacterium]